jgi:hypothetical protein
MVAAISFMETPLKFQAPGITLPLGLGIGRTVFQTMNMIEIALAVILTFALYYRRPKVKTPLAMFAAVMILLIVQTMWLLPVLNIRTEAILNGQTPPPSMLHIIYIIFDSAKLILLFAMGTVLVRQNIVKT